MMVIFIFDYQLEKKSEAINFYEKANLTLNLKLDNQSTFKRIISNF